MKKIRNRDSDYALIWAKRIRAINLLGGKCSKCGTDDIFTLSFNHRGEKKFKLSGDNLYRKWGVVKEEVRNCELLCMNCHQERHYKTNGIKKRLLELKGEFKCCICGYENKDNLSSLDFHHKGEKEKSFRIGRSYNQKMMTLPLEVILEELDKCIVVCRNCHKKIHIDIERFNRNRKYIYEKVLTHSSQPTSKKSEILELFKNGKKQIEIAKEVGCTKSTVSRIVNLYGGIAQVVRAGSS